MGWTEGTFLLATALVAWLLVTAWRRRGRVRKRKQAAAICYRRKTDGDAGVEFLLVRTNNDRRWIFPKGRIERGETAAQAAAREAHEEAGVEGMCGDVFPECRYGQSEVVPLLFEVSEIGANGVGERRWDWFDPRGARAALRENRPKSQAGILLRILSLAQKRLERIDK